MLIIVGKCKGVGSYPHYPQPLLLRRYPLYMYKNCGETDSLHEETVMENETQKNEAAAKHLMGVIVWIAITLVCAFFGCVGWVIIDRIGSGLL